MPEAHGTLRLLHVEDDDFAAGALAEVAREGAIEVVRCVTAAAGVQLAAAEAFDVIVFDRMLPDGDGAAAIAQLRALNVTTPVLVLPACAR